ncbi:exo-alpha-sialidase [Roseovarius sp. MMSF_3281]|uniref:exo-alpha-sialidase n=1 Tax=Roseovarius sp. MMSF_3281 TaxID=3046694 RepID=UPI00273E39DA|nr:exo-alpha-sialidase [Roseovarius sp. MMSF_3281]
MGALHLGLLALGLVSVLLSGYAVWRDRPLEWRFALPAAVAPVGAPVLERVFDYKASEGVAHAPAIVVEEGGARIVWFEGSAEAQPDVDIHSVALTLGPEGWQAGESAAYFTRDELGAAMEPRQLVVTLGNVVENEARQASVFATVVSVGGWAMASVADVQMGEGGPVSARKLNLSPFLNRSHLVKSPMVVYADGSHALPAYFEMGGTHGTLVRFGAEGRVRDTRRITGPGKMIQPMIVPLDEARAVAFLRDFDRSDRLWISRTQDGGQSWSVAEKTGMANPSAPVAAVGLGDGRILMAANDVEGAGDLRLLTSEDEGATWKVVTVLEPDTAGARYPMLRRVGEQFLLTYSHDTKRGIRAVVFNAAWVAAQ